MTWAGNRPVVADDVVWRFLPLYRVEVVKCYIAIPARYEYFLLSDGKGKLEHNFRVWQPPICTWHFSQCDIRQV